VQTFIKNEAGTAAFSIDGATLGVVARDPFGGSNDQAYATFSRSELEQIRDAISEELARTAGKFEVRIYNQDAELQTVFSVANVAQTAPGPITAQYPALGQFVSHEQDGSRDEYRYAGGRVEVRKTA
jgi:hypothetical protein